MYNVLSKFMSSVSVCIRSYDCLHVAHRPQLGYASDSWVFIRGYCYGLLCDKGSWALSFVWVRLSHWTQNSLGSQQAQRSSYFILPGDGVTGMCLHTQLLHRCWGSGLHPHASTAGTLPTELSPQSQLTMGWGLKRCVGKNPARLRCGQVLGGWGASIRCLV